MIFRLKIKSTTSTPPQIQRQVCAIVRCVEWTTDAGAAIDWGALSRILSTLRLGHEGDVVYVRGGPLHGHLGTGQLINAVWGSPVWDARQAGVYAKANLPFASTSLEFFTPGVLTAYALSGARVASKPFRLLVDEHAAGVGGALLQSLRRVEVATEVAADALLPVADAAVVPGQRALPTGTRPLLGGVVEATWDLFPESWWIQLTPLATSSAQWGLTSSGEGRPQIGAGGGGGLRAQMAFPYVAARIEGVVGLQTQAHRAGVFGGLYLLERRALLVPLDATTRSTLGRGIARVPAPGGLFGRASGEFIVADILRVGARVQVEEASAANVAEAWADVALWTFRGGARVIRRDLVTDRGATAFAFGGQTLLALEARWAFWGPFAASARVQRLPRFAASALRIDDDIFLGLEAAFVFGLQRSLLEWVD